MVASVETLNQLFLAELSALSGFAGRREAEGALSLGTDDPDIRRLIEAMAFFSARTRAAAGSATVSAVRRIAAGTLDELLVPNPAAMMVECVVKDAPPQMVLLPRGTLLRATTAGGKVGLFSTTRPQPILPFEIESAKLVDEKRRLYVLLRISAKRECAEHVSIPLYVRRLDDYRASLTLLDAMQRHLSRAFVTTSADAPETACRVSFGAPRTVSPEDGDDRGPLARIRSFFHLPEQELFLQVDIPKLRKPWSTIDLYIELDEGFPTSLSVSNDTFRLNVVPAENVWVDFAEPILWDGTKTSAPVRSPNPVLESVLPIAVRGVFRSSDKGLAPVLPAALAQGGDTYEVLEGDDMRVALSLDGVFEKPVKVLVESIFSQPEVWSAPPGRLKLSLQTRFLPGLEFLPMGAIKAPTESVLSRDPARSLDVLSLRMRPTLGRRDLVGMLDILGTAADGPYRGFATLVDELTSREAHDPERRASGIRRVYKLAVRQRNVEEAPLLRRFAEQIALLLDAWTEDPVDVETTTHPAPAARSLSGGTAG